MTTILLHGRLTLGDVASFLSGKCRVRIAPRVKERLRRVRRFVEKKAASAEAYYGINTGVGRLAGEKIAPHLLEELQKNVILSHAVGVGEPFPQAIARLIMLLRASALAAGFSGARLKVLELLVACLNKGITPVIPRQGSVGASGDLAPLAHVGLMLIGRGDVDQHGRRTKAATALRRAKLKPLTLQAKEGLALVNGTQAILAVGCHALLKGLELVKVADITGALAIEGDRASARPFDRRIHAVRPHPGQKRTADNVRRLLRGSAIIAGHAHCHRVQDPYSFRCIPQVHGAAKDAVAYVKKVLECELTSSTDNPLVFPADDAILSGGNFHGEPLAIALDLLCIALAELGSIAERRVALLTAPLEGELPTAFLVPNPGLNSGLMVPHVTMSALVAENKILCHPASVDSIPTSGGQEDHVSMGLHAAEKALTIATNLEKILAIELFATCQAIDMQREKETPGNGTGAVYRLVRRHIPPIRRDREFHLDIEQCRQLVARGKVTAAAEAAVGPLKLQ